MCDAEAERGKCGLGGTGWSGKTDQSLAKFAVTYGVTNWTVTHWILARASRSLELSAVGPMAAKHPTWVRICRPVSTNTLGFRGAGGRCRPEMSSRW